MSHPSRFRRSLCALALGAAVLSPAHAERIIDEYRASMPLSYSQIKESFSR